MNANNVLALLHFLSIFWFVAGLGAVIAPLFRAWRSTDVRFQMMAFEQAHRSAGMLLLPGYILTGATGVFWGAEKGYNLITTGWLVALEGIYLFGLLLCLPLMSLGLRRARLLALQAAKDGRITPELEEVLADNVPRVFAVITVLLVLAMAYLAVVRPF